MNTDTLKSVHGRQDYQSQTTTKRIDTKASAELTGIDSVTFGQQTEGI